MPPAHAKGITVTIYMALLSVHPTNALFRKAETDVRDGIESPEANMFRWSREKPAPSERPADFPEYEGGWAFSETARQWFVTSWEYPAPDYANRETRDYVRASCGSGSTPASTGSSSTFRCRSWACDPTT